MALKIICDSAADIGQSEMNGVFVAPMSVSFGNVTYQDGVDLTHDRFYEMLVESDSLPTTGQVTPYGFTQVLESALGERDEAVVMTVSSKLSGTYQSACVAAGEYGDRVRVIDTLNVSLGERILVELANHLVAAGSGLDEVVTTIEGSRGDVQMVALLDTLEYLRKGGRVSGLAGALGAMLSIKPVLACQNGEMILLGKARGSKNGRNLLNEQIEAAGGVDFSLPLAVGYSGMSSALLDKYIRDSRSLWKDHVDELPTVSIGATIGTHAGPNGIAVAFFAKGK